MERSTVGALLRSTQALCQQICEKQTLDFGIAFYSKQFPGLPDANQMREVTIADADKMPDAFEQTLAFYAAQELKCLRWSAALDVETQAMSAFLSARGYAARILDVFQLAKWQEQTSSPDIRVVPARALRTAFQETFLEAAAPGDSTDKNTLAESFLERLDDPQLDMFVATVDKKPAGRCGLYQTGDIARVLDLFVLPEFADSEAAESLLSHVLALARRLTMPMVVTQAQKDDHLRVELLQRAGFVAGGRVVEFELASAFSQVAPL